MSPFDDVDYFVDPSIVGDPYPYLEYVRSHGPVWREPHHGVVAVSGHQEALEVYRDTRTYSSCNSPTGPFPGFPVPLEGDDVSDLIEAHRAELPLSDLLVTFDPPHHAAHRALLMRLLTPRRLKENEEFMWAAADRQIDEFLGKGQCEFIGEYAQPFALLVIADLLGVPESDHHLFREKMGALTFGALGGEEESDDPAVFLSEWFTTYVEDRRAHPREDVLTHLASAQFPDGTVPEVLDIVRLASFLFAAGQETTARFLASAMRMLAEAPDLQATLRRDRELIPNFVEEGLRMESPTKADFRLARVTTTLGGVDIPAGTTVMVLFGAVNRDPRQFDTPQSLDVRRANAREHLAFGRGIHFCPGAPLARLESQISLNRLLDRTSEIRLSPAKHGVGPHDFNYLPTYLMRGLTALHLELVGADHGQA